VRLHKELVQSLHLDRNVFIVVRLALFPLQLRPLVHHSGRPRPDTEPVGDMAGSMNAKDERLEAGRGGGIEDGGDGMRRVEGVLGEEEEGGDHGTGDAEDEGK
jgi:hypothetical protein